MNLGANGSLCASLPFKRENNELNIRRDLKGGLKRKALLATSALVPVAMANLLFTPEAEAVTLDRDYFRELPEFGRVLYHAVNAVEWEIDEETGALKVLFDDGWRGVFEVGEFCFDGDELFLWPENIFIQAFPVHAVWNVLWGHPAGVMAGGGIWWLLGRNDPPVAVDDALAFTEGDNQGDNEETLSFNVLGDDYDENNDTISLLPFADVTGTFGRFTMNAAGTDIEYHFLDDINATNLAEGETGTDTARYQIQDEHGLTDTATLTVTVTGINKQVVDGNEPSEKPNDGDVSEDATSAVTLTNLLVNASDADGGVPFISAVAGGTLGGVVDVNGGGSFTITANGAATFDPDGDFETLAKGDVATASIDYTVSDGRGSTTTSTVTVTVVGENDAPVAKSDFTGSATEDAGAKTITFNAVTSATDVDAGTSLTLALSNETAKYGDFVVSNDGKKVEYKFDDDGEADKLAAGETAKETVTHTINDGNGGSDSETITVTITGVNDAPVAKADFTGSATEGAGTKTITFNAVTSATDVDAGTSLTLSGTLTNETSDYGAFAVTSNGKKVEYKFDDDGEADKLAAGATAKETVTYTINDDEGGSDSETITVTITGVNDAPVAKADFTGSATEDAGAKTITFNAVTSATDVDAGTSLTLSSALSNETSNYGAFAVTSNGKKVEYKFADDGEADKLEAGETAKETVTYTINDGNGGSDSETITVTITGVNDAPTVETKANDIALQDTDTQDDAVFLVPADGGGYETTASGSIGLTFDDVDDVNSSLALTASGLQTGWSFTSNGSITGTAALTDPLKAETHTVTVTATDDGDADNSNPLSASDELDIYIGLKIPNADNITVANIESITGSNVADDYVNLTLDNLGAGKEVTIVLGEGENYFNTRYEAASNGGKISYTGGDGSDELWFRQFVAKDKGEVTIDAGNGYNKLYLGNEAAGNGGSITYTGGTGTDEIETNNKLAHGSGKVTFDLGSDTSNDVVIFNNSVAPSDGVVIIQNFDAGEDGTAAEDKMIFKKLDNVNDLSFTPSGSDVIVQSTGSADVYVKLIVADASTSDFNLSIDSNGDLWIN